MSSPSVGLVKKYRVARTDGKSVEWCFVLEDKDPFAVVALDAYSQIAELAGYRALAYDLNDKLADLGVHGLREPGHRCGKPGLDAFSLADVSVSLPSPSAVVKGAEG